MMVYWTGVRRLGTTSTLPCSDAIRIRRTYPHDSDPSFDAVCRFSQHTCHRVRSVRRARVHMNRAFNELYSSPPSCRCEESGRGRFAGRRRHVRRPAVDRGVRGAVECRQEEGCRRAVSWTTKINKNTTKIGIEGPGRSVPDVLQKGITEIKSGVEINNSVRLRVQAETRCGTLEGRFNGSVLRQMPSHHLK